MRKSQLDEAIEELKQDITDKENVIENEKGVLVGMNNALETMMQTRARLKAVKPKFDFKTTKVKEVV